MKNQAYRMALLYDFYGDMLTDRQKEFYDLYYNEDLSLAEIAENYGITRQVWMSEDIPVSTIVPSRIAPLPLEEARFLDSAAW